MVRFIEPHPELEDRKLYVSVKEGNPIDAIREAIDKVVEYFSNVNVTYHESFDSNNKNSKVSKTLKNKKSEPYGLDGKKSEPYGLDGKKSEPYGLEGN